jgi:hypothetical protein
MHAIYTYTYTYTCTHTYLSGVVVHELGSFGVLVRLLAAGEGRPGGEGQVLLSLVVLGIASNLIVYTYMLYLIIKDE